MKTTTLDDVLLQLSFINGETSIPVETADRSSYVQTTLDEVYARYPWPFAQITATLAVVNGQATLPQNMLYEGARDVRLVRSGANDDDKYEEVEFEDMDNYTEGAYKWWTTSDGSNYFLNTKENVDYLTLRYQREAPAIAGGTETTPFPSSMVLALGAFRFVRIADTFEGDVSQDFDIFETELNKVIASYNRTRPRRRIKGVQERAGHRTGDV